MKPSTEELQEVESRSLEKLAETGTSLEETYMKAGLSPDDASFLANFTEEQRKKCIRKVDWRLPPVLMILYLCAYIDRANIGNAKIEGLLEDLNMSGPQYNIALAIFFIPYVLCEVPSNILLGRFKRPSVYIGILTLGWGIIMTLTCVVNNFAGLVVTRFLLGVFEAGFFPGAVWTISRWYLPHETQTRLAIFYTASALAGAFSGLLAFGLAKLDVDTPALSTGWLEPQEIRYLELRLLAQRGRQVVDEKANKFDWKTLFSVLKDGHLYLQVLNFWSNAVPNYGLKFTMPQIIRNMGYTSANAQLLTMPPYFAGAISAFVSSFYADRLRWRMPPIVMGQICVIVAFAILFAKAAEIESNIALCYFAVVLACIGFYPILPATNAWTLNNLAGERKRAMGIAFMISLGNCGGIPGSFIYIEKEKPKYPTGFGSSFAFASSGVIAALVLEYILTVRNKRRAKLSEEEIHTKYTDEQLQKMGDRSPLFKYTL
ncbi:hypothetical protein ACJ72_03789 [Emergomyces africanus]|uniref:Major facilitator superfamily (MFS) profile domain-containing protein n=1 Tax=Emergomyces africanus TaxID=1955775 RepID=A0A1B7NYL5_9EURO|nr:hypothetical protein ACJ72_03789 [Emergomyces africanus]